MFCKNAEHVITTCHSGQKVMIFYIQNLPKCSSKGPTGNVISLMICGDIVNKWIQRKRYFWEKVGSEWWWMIYYILQNMPQLPSKGQNGVLMLGGSMWGNKGDQKLTYFWSRGWTWPLAVWAKKWWFSILPIRH